MANNAALPLEAARPGVVLGFDHEISSGNSSDTCIPIFSKNYQQSTADYCDLIISERVLTHVHVRYMSLPVRPSVCPTVVCRLSFVRLVRPTQAIEVFGNVSTPFGTLIICHLSIKILRRSSQGNPSCGG